ncbi:ODA1 [Symbiodinium sp. KB8]|nr:ODA1 [Symbiodinium sp. KB8]
MIKYNEAQSIRKTYEQIVKRLKEERVGFDNQLAAIERTLKAKEQDYDELQVLAGDAAHARENALAELEKTKAEFEQEQQKFEREKREKLNVLRARAHNRELTKRQQEMKHKLKQSAENANKSSEDDEEAVSGALLQESMEQKAKIERYEEALRRIKEVTGVSDVNEVIQKIVSQEDQQQSLEELTKENARKIEKMNNEVAALKEKVDTLKFSTSGGGIGARKMVDGYEEQLTLATQRLERAKDKYERSARILINVKAGVDHLEDKLRSIMKDEPAMSDIAPPDNENIVDVLLKSEETVVRLLDIVEKAEAERTTQEFNEAIQARHHRGCCACEAKQSFKGRSGHQHFIAWDERRGVEEDEEEEEDFTGAEDDAVSRDTVKRDAIQVVSAQRRKENRRRRKKDTA